ncbi:MAG: type II secretion system protein [Solirubrobacteraceae bacterium]
MNFRSYFKSTVAGERGFTLIELLVVILIIGILAAIAIPSFLNQKGKAVDASAKELGHTAQIAAESYSTDHSGDYSGLSKANLATYEATITTASGSGNAWVQCVGAAGSTAACAGNAGPTGYTIEIDPASGGERFFLSRQNGSIHRTCLVNNATGASGGGCVGGTW